MENMDIDRVVDAAIEVVNDAHANNKLHQLTNRLVRQEVEKKLDLEAGALEEKPYKKRLSEAISETVVRLRAQKDDSKTEQKKKKEEQQEKTAKPSSSSKKRKPVSNESTEASKSKPRSSTSTKSRNSDRIIASPKPVPAEEKPKRRNSKLSEDSKHNMPEEKSGSTKMKEKYKSRDTVISDDDEEDTNERVSVSAISAVSSKKKGKRAVLSESEDGAEGSTTPKKRKKSESAPSKKTEGKIDAKVEKESDVHMDAPDKNGKGSAAGDVEVSKSDSELSSLIEDVPTKKRRMSKTKKATGDSKERKARTKKETKEISSDEEQVKKLKGLVVACGVRKVWSKELKNCETPSSQITHLRKLLTDLGMKGRFSLEQAKAIKAKRDLAREMEDVQEFAQRYAGGRPKRSTDKQKPTSTASDEGEEEEEVEPSRRPKNAHRSIMDFLDEQSGSE